MGKLLPDPRSHTAWLGSSHAESYQCVGSSPTSLSLLVKVGFRLPPTCGCEALESRRTFRDVRLAVARRRSSSRDLPTGHGSATTTGDVDLIKNLTLDCTTHRTAKGEWWSSPSQIQMSRQVSRYCNWQDTDTAADLLLLIDASP